MPMSRGASIGREKRATTYILRSQYFQSRCTARNIGSSVSYLWSAHLPCTFALPFFSLVFTPVVATLCTRMQTIPIRKDDSQACDVSMTELRKLNMDCCRLVRRIMFERSNFRMSKKHRFVFQLAS